MKLGQLVARDDHVLHPCSCDHHQVSYASADVVSAHGQSESCEHRDGDGVEVRGRNKPGRRQRTDPEELFHWVSTDHVRICGSIRHII